MGHLDLAIYPQIALIIFLAIFAGMLVRVFSRSGTREFGHLAALPLEDDARPGPGQRENGSKP